MTNPARLSLLLAGILLAAPPALAHNSGVHRDMTDWSYGILLALSKGQLEINGDPALTELAQAAKEAVGKLQVLPAGLPPPKQSVCGDPEVVKKFGSSPSWGAPAAGFGKMTLGNVPYPISTAYKSGNTCGIDGGWTPGPFFDSVNPAGAPGGRDYTGVVLGFWAQNPDDELDDWHIFHRLTNMAGFSEGKQIIETAAGAAAGTVWIPVRCVVECLGSLIGLGDCEECVDKAVEEAGSAVHEGISTIDGLGPGFEDATSLDYTGMGHHLDVVASAGDYDDLRGLLVDSSGPTGAPDFVEVLAMTGATAIGKTVHYEPSHGPKNYEILGANDFHPDSVDRDEDDWQYLSFPHIPFTPLDNLAFHGWRNIRNAPKDNVPALAFPLHAFGDAIVPMHVTGTFGYGHRPYEDAFENVLTTYFNKDDRGVTARQALAIAKRAVAWRRFIQEWRAEHPERGKDVPVREMVTRLARWTFEQVEGPAMFNWPFHPAQSSLYLIPGPTRELSILFYENAPGSEEANRNLLEEGMAAEVAFLISAMEVVP